MKIKKALGIDFGTSNSYFSEVSGDVNPIYEDLKFHNSESTVPTCILYKKNNGELMPFDFGQSAEDLWTELEEDERGEYEFYSGFKPDLAHDTQAYAHTIAFFKCVKAYFEKEGLDYFNASAERTIVVGIPAINIDGQEKKTQKAFKDAGLPKPILVAEPQGALFYHLLFDQQKLTIDKAHRGVIVIDFGGGTLDIAYLKNCQVKNIWGNPLIGGRLFDDLFFQWFLEKQNDPDLLQQIKEDGNLQTVMNVSCRKLKERFSNSWDNGRIDRFRDRVSVGIDYDYGVFRKNSLDEFNEKMRNYKMSDELLKILSLLDNAVVGKAKRGEKIDLYSMIKQEISAGDIEEVSTVILTGGSCRWPFMKEITDELFPNADVFRSNNPEATISRGLGTKIMMDERTKYVAKQLQGSKEVLHQKLIQLISDEYQKFITQVNDKFSNDFFDLKVRKMFIEWRESGGTATSIETKAEEIASEYFSQDAKIVMKKHKDILQNALQEKANNEIELWLRDNEIQHIEYLDMPVDFDGNISMGSGIENLLDGIFSYIEIFIAALFGIITGSVLGGAGTALLMSGPIGWIIGFILGAAGTIVAISNVNVKDIHLPAWSLKMFITDAQLEEAKKKFRQSIDEKMSEAFVEMKPNLEEKSRIEIDVLVREVTKRLSVTAILKN